MELYSLLSDNFPGDDTIRDIAKNLNPESVSAVFSGGAVPFSLDPLPGDNEIECARCGALIFDQLSRCPNCGVNLYEPEEELEYDPDESGLPASSGLTAKIGGFFRSIFKKPYSAEEVFGSSLDQALYYNELLQKVGSDRQVVERLVAFEKQLKPNSTRINWLKEALQRWEKDNRTSFKTE